MRRDDLTAWAGPGEVIARSRPFLVLMFAGALACFGAIHAPVCGDGNDSPIEIHGDARFERQVTQALFLLETKAPEAYEIVRQYIGRIRQGKHSGMWAYKSPPTFELADRTAFYSVTWCASAIAHDSIHSQLYHQHKATVSGRVPPDVWIGSDAEVKCIQHQVAILKKIGAPQREIDYCSRLDGTHYDVNKDGEYDWQDMPGRDW